MAIFFDEIYQCIEYTMKKDFFINIPFFYFKNSRARQNAGIPF